MYAASSMREKVDSLLIGRGRENTIYAMVGLRIIAGAVYLPCNGVRTVDSLSVRHQTQTQTQTETSLKSATMRSHLFVMRTHTHLALASTHYIVVSLALPHAVAIRFGPTAMK